MLHGLRNDVHSEAEMMNLKRLIMEVEVSDNVTENLRPRKVIH